MKKLICLFLLLCMTFSLAACNRGEGGAEEPTDDQSGGAASEEPQQPVAQIQEKSLYLFEGEEYVLHYQILGEETDKLKVVWTSSSDCVTVSDGRVQAKKEGFAILSGGGSSTCVVSVLSREMPILSVNTQGVSITSKEEYVPCFVGMDSENEAFCFEGVDAGIRIRGNSTATLPKKPYRIKFESARNLLGMNQGAECKSWVLLAERYDDSMIRNSSAMTFASMILKEYSSDFRYVTLMLNGKNMGLYLLCEQSQINKNRINIEEAGADSPDLKSGYLYEIDASTNPPDFYLEYGDYTIYNFLGDAYTMKANDSGKKALFYSLKNDGLSAEQKSFAEKYIEGVFRILYCATFENTCLEFDSNYELVASNKTAREVIEAVIDVDSVVRKYIHSEIFCNGDEHKKSFFMYADLSEGGTGKLTFTCPWDFDTAFVHWESVNYRDPEAYYSCTRQLWYVVLMNHEWFREEVSAVWQELYTETNGFANALQLIPNVTDIYRSEIAYDMTRWNRTWDQEEQALLTHQWLIKRIAWLNSQFGVDANS